MAFLGQYWAILCTFIKLKRWRFLWLLIFGISAMSNHLLYKVVGSWVANFGMQSYLLIGGDDFADNSVIVGSVKQQEKEFSVLTSLINEQRNGAGNKYTIQDCSQSTKDACSMQLLSLMVSQSANKFSHHVEFAGNGRSKPRIICNIAYGSETYCPFLASLVSTASYGVLNAPFRFKNITTFRYVPVKKSSLKASGDSAAMCARDPEYVTVMPRTVLVQTFLLLCSVFIYLLASTVPCIVDLKGRDFLQLLFRRGLSVSAYWLAVWTVTLIELLLIAVLLAVSHHLQCPGFYETTRLGRLVLAFVVQTCAIASLVFFLTVVMQTQFVIGVATLLLASACCVVLALSLILLHWLSGISGAKFALLALPPGLLGEQLQAILVSKLRPEAETEFHTMALILGGCTWAGSLLLTLYLDFVLSSGNGLFLRTLHFPCAMLCGHKRRQLAEETREPAHATVEPVHGLRPVLQIRNLSKAFVSCTGRGNIVALNNVSATLYENQLTAFVGHNGSGKSALFNILTGKTMASAGNVFLSGYNLSHAKTRYSLAPSIGICYQHDALCGGITVADSIGLVLRACNMSVSEIHEAELEHILTQLGLKEKLGLRVCNLSTGQKRKLCTTLALIGNPNLIILDEPTSNLDPVSRRQLWKLLQEYRPDRCIVLTTSLMEEADVLADRKIFLSGGSLICAGSSLFLRRAFDCGFIFQTRVKTERHVGWILRAVNQRYPTVRARSIYRSNIELEVSPLEDRLLPGVAEALEKLPDLVESFELAQHSLEQIFSRLRSMPLADVERLFKSGEIGYTVNDPLDSTQQQQTRQSTVLSRTWPKSAARLAPSLKKRILAMSAICCARIRRKRSAIFSRIVFPVLLLLLLICSLVGELIARRSQLDIWVSLRSNGQANFTKGLCIDDSDLPGHRHYPVSLLCKELLAPQINISEQSFIFTSKQKSISVYAHFAGVINNNPEFQSQCSKVSARYEPCPVIYASNWCEDTVNNAVRDIAIGFYSLYDYFNIELVIEYLLEIYRRALIRYNSVFAKHVTMDVEVIGVKDFRTTFLPLFGLFFQIIILCIVPATYLDDLMEDKASGVRKQLNALGMSCGHYWICIFMAHWMQYSILYSISTVLLCAVLPGSYFSSSFLLCIFLPTLVLGLASNQLSAYFVSTIFERSNAVLTVVYSLFSVILGLSLLLAQLDNMAGLVIICVFPPAASVALTFYGGKLIVYALAFMKVNKVTELSDPLGLLFMSLHIKIALIAMLAHIVLLCLAIYIMERRSSMKCCCCSNRNADKGPAFAPSDDAGVQDETERLDKHQRDQANLLEVRHLRILASSGEKIVRDVSFAVRRGEIFGLLGPNGSGKTSVVSAIAGDLRPHGGTCEVPGPGNRWLPSHVAASGGKIGHCQSSDPLLSHVTVEEHLKFYAAVLGVSSDSCKILVQELVNTFHLEESKDKMTFQISKGCKRRLSMAISLLGDPSIVAIDDPSEGVDPEGRRLIWAAIRSIASENRAVVVTMQTMEEVDGLCSRVGIMNQGLLVGIGTMDQILNRYGQIYTLSIQLEEDVSESGALRQARIDSMLKAVRGKFPDAFVVEQMAASALVCVPFSNIDRLSNVLKWLVDFKNSLGIAIFSLRRVYLDEIFQLIIKSHDDKLLRERYSIFSMTEAMPLNQMGDSTQAPNSAEA